MRRILQAFVKGKNAYLRELMPNDILTVLSDNGISFTRQDLDYWSAWEYGHRDISESEFLLSVLGELTGSNEDVVVVSDDCFTSRDVYKLTASDLLSFSNTHPEMAHLFQPFDHIFYFPNIAVLIVVHHEGAVFRINMRETALV